MPQAILNRFEINRGRVLLGLKTRERVRELRESNLFMSMSEIGRLVGISRQRVFQILQEEGLPTKHLSMKVNKHRYHCQVCGKISSHQLCSDECKKQWQQIPIVCTNCDRLFFRDVHQFLANYRNHSNSLFCSRDCQSKWIGEHCGFKSRPNRSVRGVQREHNWDDVWRSHIENGYGPLKLSRQLDIPASTVAYILSHYQKTKHK